MKQIPVLAIVAAFLVTPAMSQDRIEGTGFMVAKGRVTFRVYCASCHGKSAEGNGTVAHNLTVQPANLTQIRERNEGQFPREDIAAMIDGRTLGKPHGSRVMPVWGDIFQSPLAEGEPAPLENGEERAQRKIQELVLYLESIQPQS